MLHFMTPKPLFISIALSLSLCVACGGSDSDNNTAGAPNNSSGSYSSGIAGDKQLASLTDQEFAGLCKKLDDYFSTGTLNKSLQEFTCRFAGLFAGGAAQTDAELQAACKPAYESCIGGQTTTDHTCSKPEASCTATVAEYDACANDAAKQLAKLGTALPSCDKLTASSLQTVDLGSSTQAPASCTLLTSKCPSAPKPPGYGDVTAP